MKRSNRVAAAGEAEWDKPELLSSANLTSYSPMLFAWPCPWAPDHLLQVCLDASTDRLLTPSITHWWNKSLMPRCRQWWSAPFGSQKSWLLLGIWDWKSSTPLALALHSDMFPKSCWYQKCLTQRNKAENQATIFFFLWVPSRVTQSARFICGTVDAVMQRDVGSALIFHMLIFTDCSAIGLDLQRGTKEK